MKIRCRWCGQDPLYMQYHDEEWGVPVHDDRKFFEMLILEGVQAGLSWITVLRKRDNYRYAFDNFDCEKVAAYDDAKIAALLADAGIIRNKLKITAAVKNAQAFLDIQREYGSFDHYIWRYVDGKPIQNTWASHEHVPAITKEAEQISKDLRKRGFKFVGPTICYAFMQAVGMVNDHTTDCFRHSAIST